MPDLDAVFRSCRELLAPYGGRGFQITNDAPGKFELIAKGEFEAYGKKRKEIYFAALVMNKGSVVLHFMPAYGSPELCAKLDPIFMKTLQGKACFHFKDWTPELSVAVADALEKGHAAFDRMGWVEQS